MDDSKEWQGILRWILQKKSQVVAGYNPDVLSRRVEGYVGRELEYDGFRSAILYLQLTPNINLDVICEAVKLIDSKMGANSKKAYHTLFLNNTAGKLVYPESIVYGKTNATLIIKSYYEKYALEYEEYSKTLNQLFPLVDIYSKTSYPSKEDLFVIFQDEGGIKINDDLHKKIKGFRKNFITVTCEENRNVRISPNLIL